MSDSSPASPDLRAAHDAVASESDRRAALLVARTALRDGVACNERGEYVRALERFETAERSFDEIGEPDGRADAFMNIGTVHFRLGNFAWALANYDRALTLHEGLGNRQGIARATGNIGTVHSQFGEHARALEYFESALATLEEIGGRADIAISLGYIAQTNRRLGAHERGLRQARHALSIFEEIGDRAGIASATREVGATLVDLGRHAEALEHFARSIELSRELGDPESIAQDHMSLGALYAREEFDGHDPARAEKHLLEAVALLGIIGSRPALRWGHEYLAKLYQLQGRWRESHEHLSRSHALHGELLTTEARTKTEQIEHFRQIAELEQRRALEKAEEQAAREALGLRAQLLEEQIDRQRAALAAQAMSMARQAELLGDVRRQLDAIVRTERNPRSVIVRITERLRELPHEVMDWPRFEAEFHSSYPTFQSSLLQRWPELTGMEMKVCALLKLRLTSADVARVLTLSERSVEGHRLRIRRKMQLLASDDLHHVLAGI
jgi:tetratricopeptide (TPR) repeat protein/DNA-binding CsgD family transcriptional regulator